MTFSEWYAANVEPAMIQNANQLPDPEQRKIVLQAARDSMAACWNAALDAGDQELHSNPAVLRSGQDAQPQGEAVTFEQWWAGLINQPIPQLRPTFTTFKACWNGALEAMRKQIESKHFTRFAAHILKCRQNKNS